VGAVDAVANDVREL